VQIAFPYSWFLNVADVLNGRGLRYQSFNIEPAVIDCIAANTSVDRLVESAMA